MYPLVEDMSKICARPLPRVYALGRGRAYIFDMSSTSGYMGEKYFHEFGPRFFDMSSASGYMGEKYFQEFGPRFLACHVIFGVSCSKCCVSWRVNIYRVNKFRVVSCQNSACQRVLPYRGHPDVA